MFHYLITIWGPCTTGPPTLFWISLWSDAATLASDIQWLSRTSPIGVLGDASFAAAEDCEEYKTQQIRNRWMSFLWLILWQETSRKDSCTDSILVLWISDFCSYSFACILCSSAWYMHMRTQKKMSSVFGIALDELVEWVPHCDIVVFQTQRDPAERVPFTWGVGALVNTACVPARHFQTLHIIVTEESLCGTALGYIEQIDVCNLIGETVWNLYECVWISHNDTVCSLLSLLAKSIWGRYHTPPYSTWDARQGQNCSQMTSHAVGTAIRLAAFSFFEVLCLCDLVKHVPVDSSSVVHADLKVWVVLFLCISSSYLVILKASAGVKLMQTPIQAAAEV